MQAISVPFIYLDNRTAQNLRVSRPAGDAAHSYLIASMGLRPEAFRAG
jgi:hypothetical protein